MHLFSTDPIYCYLFARGLTNLLGSTITQDRYILLMEFNSTAKYAINKFFYQKLLLYPLFFFF